MTGAYRFGPIIGRNDVTFRLWAPGAKNVTLLCDDRQATDRSEDGWFTKRGTRRFSIRLSALPAAQRCWAR